MSKKTKNEILLGGFIVVAGGLLAAMSLAVGGLSMTSGIHVKARFANASGLVKDAMVSVAGVQVGHIERLEVDHDTAIVHLFVNQSAGIHKDVRAMIRAKSLLGEKYLELQPQARDGALLADNDEIVNTKASVEVDEVLAALGPLLKKIDPNDMATLLHVAATTLDKEKDHVSELIQHADSVATQVDELVKKNKGHVDAAAANLASLSSDGAQILRNKKGAIERTLTNVDHVAAAADREAPQLLARGNRIAGHMEAIAADVHRDAPTMIRDAKRTLKHADAALVKIPHTLDAVDTTLGKTNPLLDKANAIKPGQIEEMAHNALARTGIKVFVAPFGPSDDEYGRLHPSPTPAPASTSKVP